MTDFRIDVVLDPSRAVRGTNRVNRALSRTENQANRLKRSMQGVFAVIGVTTLITQLVRLSDTYTNMQNRLKLVTNGTRELVAVQKELFNIADRTRSSFEATATIYSRTALSVRELGISHQQTLGFVESLNHAIILSGVNSREASNGLIQLSQGIASNTLRGDELRAVLEQLPAVADTIAEHMGVTRGELRLLGQQGKISGEDIIKAFAEAADELERKFKHTVPTIGQAFDVLTGRVVEGIGKVNEYTGAATFLSRAMIGLAHNLDLVAKAAIIAGSALALHFVKAGVNVAIFAVRALTVAIAANPIGAIAIGVITAVTALVQFGDQIKLTEDGIATLSDALDHLFTIIKRDIENGINFFRALGHEIGEMVSALADNLPAALRDFELSFGNLLRFAAFSMDRFVGIFAGAINVIGALFQKLPAVIGATVIEAVNAMAATIESFLNSTISGMNSLLDTVGLDPVDLINIPQLENDLMGDFNELGTSVAEAFNEGLVGEDTATNLVNSLLEGVDTFFVEVEKRAKANKALEEFLFPPEKPVDLTLKKEKVDRIPVALQTQLDLLEEETRILSLSNKEREIQTKFLAIESKLRASNVTLEEGGANEQLLLAAIKRNITLKQHIALLDELRGPQEELTQREESLQALYDRGSISVAMLNDQLQQLAITQANLNIEQGEGTFIDGFIVGLESMLESVRNFNAEAGMIFAELFDGVADGFADAVANAIVFGDSIQESIGNVARRALADLISGLVKLGLQYVINATLASTLGAAATATGVAQATALGAAYATPAALVSLASYGANAIPAQAGILSTTALTKGLAVAGFADGGFVSGPGGPRTDSIPARLSDGEFVVNAQSTARFRPQLEAMNSGQGFADGGMVSSGSSEPSTSGSAGSTEAAGAMRIINVIDPSMVGDFLSTQDGEDVLVNTIRENADTIRGVLG